MKGSIDRFLDCIEFMIEFALHTTKVYSNQSFSSNKMCFHSTNISEEITQFLIHKAAQRLCQEHAKRQAITELTKQQATTFTTQCSKIIVSLYNLKSNSQKSLLGKEDRLVTPTCHKKKNQFLYTSSKISPQTPSSPAVKKFSIKRMERLSTRPPLSTQTSFCLPLNINQDYDESQQLLREKKEKMANLQSFFKRSQKEEKYRYNVQKMPKNPFTTDYNGEKIELKKMSRTANIDTSFIIDVSTKIREEKQQNQRLIHQEVNQSLVRIDYCPKQNIRNPQVRKSAPVVFKKETNFTTSQASSKRVPKESLKLQHLTLRDFQKDVSTQQKTQRSKFKKYKLNTANISSIDCIRAL